LITMRVFLKRKRIGQYYRDVNQFAADPGEARDFASVPAAARFVFAEQLPETEIVLRWDALDQEVALPVLREWCELDENHRLAVRNPSPPALPPSRSV
jgi:hypothetical protein